MWAPLQRVTGSASPEISCFECRPAAVAAALEAALRHRQRIQSIYTKLAVILGKSLLPWLPLH